MDKKTPQVDHTGFPHVTFMVTDVSAMELFRDEREVTTLVSTKMNRENAEKLLNLLTEQLKNNQVGYVTCTFTGNFR